MSENEPIRERTHNERHDGRHSITRRLQSALGQLRAYRNERTFASEGGHMPPEIEEGLVEAYLPQGEGTEIELFVPAPRPTYQTKNLGEAPHMAGNSDERAI